MEFVALGFGRMGLGLIEDSGVAVWVDDVSLTLSAPVHCAGSNTRWCPNTRAQFGW